jgi:hypothetical protein
VPLQFSGDTLEATVPVSGVASFYRLVVTNAP